MNKTRLKELKKQSKTEMVTDLLSIGSSAIIWVGGPISGVLSKITANRKFKRIYDVIEEVVLDLDGFKSEASENYVKTEEFEELTEKILIKTAEERNQKKRELFRRFLLKTIKSPSTDYAEQIRYLRIIEEMQIDHLKIIKTLIEKSNLEGEKNQGVQLPALLSNLPEMKREQARDLIIHLNNLCVTEITSKDSAVIFTEFGRRFVKYLLDQ